MSTDGIGKFIRGFVHAGRGLGSAWRQQVNFRVHCGITLLALLAGALLRLSHLEWAAIILCIGLVLGAELLNSAIEALGDAITREHNPLIGQAKDLGAAAVLITALAAAVVGVIIFGRHILLLLAHS